MPAIHVAQNLDYSEVWVQGIYEIPAVDAEVGCGHPDNCPGISLSLIPPQYYTFEKYAREMQKRFIEDMRQQGYEATGRYYLHGPFMSMEYVERMVDGDSSSFEAAKPYMNDDREEHPEHTLSVVYDRPIVSAMRDYVLIAGFRKRNVLTEVVVSNGQ